MKTRRSFAVIAALMVLPVDASAQQYVLGGSAQIASGLVGGGPNATVLERARTRLRIGVDAHVDEFPKDTLALALVAELEPHSSFGIDLRYLRRLSPKIELNAGAIGFVFPESLIGPTAGMNYHLTLSHTFELTVGPEINVFVIGTDLPSESVIWQTLVQVGIHVDL